MSTTNYLYDGANIVEEIDGGGSVLAKFAQGSHVDEWLAELQPGGTSYYEEDGVDSVSSLSNLSGALANTYTFDSFGKLTGSTGTFVNPFQYTSREFDPETGIFYRAATTIRVRADLSAKTQLVSVPELTSTSTLATIPCFSTTRSDYG